MENRVFTFFIGALVFFAAAASGAHDVWAAVVVYTAVLIGCFCWLVITYRRVDREITLPFGLPLLCLLAAIAVSWWFSNTPADSALAASDWLVATLLFCLAVAVFRSEEDVDVFLLWMVPALWLESAVVIRQVIAAHNGIPSFADLFKPMPNAEKMGTLINSNILVAFVLPIFLFVFDRAAQDFRQKKWFFFSFWTSGLTAGLVCLAFAQSSAGWLCLMGAFGLWSLRFRNARWAKRSKKIVASILVIAAGIVLALLIYKFTAQIDRAVDPFRDNSNRLYWWKSAWRMFLDYRWTGVGIGSFGNAYLAYKAGGTESTLYAHSFPVQWLAETGLLGVGALLIIIGSGARRLWAQGIDALSQLPVATLISVAVFYAFNIGLEYLVNLMILALLAAWIARDMRGLAFKPRLSLLIVGGATTFSLITFWISLYLSGCYLTDGQVYLRARRWDDAEKSFQSARDLDARAWEPLEGLAAVAMGRGDRAQAVRWQTEALDRNKLNMRLLRQLEIYRRN